MKLEPFDIRLLALGGLHRLSLVGELDIASVALLKTALSELASNGTRAVTLDLSGLRFIDAAGLHAILAARELCQENGYEFLLVPGPPAVQRLFEITNLLEVLPFAAVPDDRERVETEHRELATP
jgi:anti-anti-sigma factor